MKLCYSDGLWPWMQLRKGPFIPGGVNKVLTSEYGQIVVVTRVFPAPKQSALGRPDSRGFCIPILPASRCPPFPFYFSSFFFLHSLLFLLRRSLFFVNYFQRACVFGATVDFPVGGIRSYSFRFGSPPLPAYLIANMQVCLYLR